MKETTKEKANLGNEVRRSGTLFWGSDIWAETWRVRTQAIWVYEEVHSKKSKQQMERPESEHECFVLRDQSRVIEG